MCDRNDCDGKHYRPRTFAEFNEPNGDRTSETFYMDLYNTKNMLLANGCYRITLTEVKR